MFKHHAEKEKRKILDGIPDLLSFHKVLGKQIVSPRFEGPSGVADWTTSPLSTGWSRVVRLLFRWRL